MNSNITVTRMDFLVAGEQVVVNKLFEAVLPGQKDIVVDHTTKPLAEMDSMLEWCEKHDWHVRRFLPYGARAWKGTDPRPVRTKGRIHKLAIELTKRQINSNRFDLRYDM